MENHRRMAMYYVAVRGTGRGSVRAAPFSDGSPVIRYRLSREDLANLSRGLSRLATLLLAAGAEAVHPAVHGLPAIESEVDAALWLDDVLSPDRLSLTTVHAFSTCPIGEDERTCAADSFGRLRGFENLWINDASMLPDSPGVNPQGSIMALARRNARYAAGAIG
jgi:choline dehydrogenase-like flavoprotein